MNKLLIVFLVLVSACEKRQNNNELIIAHRECIAAGMRSVLLTDGWGNSRIQCRPPREVNGE